MCLPRLGEIVTLAEHEAIVEIAGRRTTVNVMCVPQASVGDHVMIHAGYAITILTPREAAERKGLMDAVRFGTALDPRDSVVIAHPKADG